MLTGGDTAPPPSLRKYNDIRGTQAPVPGAEGFRNGPRIRSVSIRGHEMGEGRGPGDVPGSRPSAGDRATEGRSAVTAGGPLQLPGEVRQIAASWSRVRAAWAALAFARAWLGRRVMGTAAAVMTVVVVAALDVVAAGAAVMTDEAWTAGVATAGGGDGAALWETDATPIVPVAGRRYWSGAASGTSVGPPNETGVGVAEDEPLAGARAVDADLGRGPRRRSRPRPGCRRGRRRRSGPGGRG